jgi:hypothetical protein
LKRPLHLLFISFSLLLLVGFWLVLPFMMAFVKFEAWEKARHESHSLVALRLASSEFRRVEAQEIEYQGIRYDIVSETKQSQIYVFRAFADNAETELMAFIENIWSDVPPDNTSEQPFKNILQKRLSELYVGAKLPIFCFSSTSLKSNPAFYYFRPNSTAFLSIYLPPPQLG